MTLAVGVSLGQNRFHLFRTAEHPERPQVLRVDQWGTLRDSKVPAGLVDWPCGDHASPTEVELESRPMRQDSM